MVKPLHMRLVDDGLLPGRLAGAARLPQVKAGSITRHFSMKGALSRSSNVRSSPVSIV